MLKIFDLRMQNTYSYLDAKISHPQSSPSSSKDTTKYSRNSIQPTTTTFAHTDFSIFLSHRPPNTITPSHGRRRPRPTRPYRGAIYTMSSPSPSSPTVYAGISDAVFRLDFASTDDLTGSCSGWFHENLALDLNNNMSKPSPFEGGDRVLELSGYERPDPSDVSSVSRLRTQRPFSSTGLDNEMHWRYEQETGWDRRWARLNEDDNAPWKGRNNVNDRYYYRPALTV